MTQEAEFLVEIQTKIIRVFLLAIHSHLYSFASRFNFFKLMQPLTVSASVIVHCEGQKRKPDRKTYHLPYGLRNPYSSLKSEFSQDYAQKPQGNCQFMNSAPRVAYLGTKTAITCHTKAGDLVRKLSQLTPAQLRYAG
jgi:hypothetical protein